jgi:tripeptide aminopeptidase
MPLTIMFSQYTFTSVPRFLRYVQIDTQSDPQSNTHPSTEKQKVLAVILVEELRQMGITDAYTDQYGYVYAGIPSTTTKKFHQFVFAVI